MTTDNEYEQMIDDDEMVNSKEQFDKKMKEDALFRNLVMANNHHGDSFSVLCDAILVLRDEIDELKKELRNG